MPKGPEFLEGNARRHRERNNDPPLWSAVCAGTDVEALRVRLSIEYVKARGGLTREEKQLLKSRISDIQKVRAKRDARILREIMKEAI